MQHDPDSLGDLFVVYATGFLHGAGLVVVAMAGVAILGSLW